MAVIEFVYNPPIEILRLGLRFDGCGINPAFLLCFPLCSGPPSKPTDRCTESMDSDREQLASVLTRNLPFIFGLVGRRCGGEEETAGEVVERIVVLDPAMQRMILIKADGGSGASLDELVRQASEAESGKRGPPPVSAASIEAMPTVEVAAEEGMDCAACLERVMGAAKEMPCRHRYHQECVEKCRPGYLCRVVSGVKLLLDPPYIVRVATLDFLLLACLEIWLCGCMETLDHGSDDHGWRIFVFFKYLH